MRYGCLSFEIPNDLLLTRRTGIPYKNILVLRFRRAAKLTAQRYTVSKVVHELFRASQLWGKTKGREFVAPPQEAPRSAHPENAPCRAGLGTCLGLVSGSEKSRLS
jgi:hypothetical protein